MQGILRIITARVETKKQRKIMNKSGIITTHGLTLNLLTSFFMILILPLYTFRSISAIFPSANDDNASSVRCKLGYSR